MRVALIVGIVLGIAIVVGALAPAVPRWSLGLGALVAALFVQVAFRKAGAAAGAPSPDDESGRSAGEATCAHCSARFGYFLVHNGFNDSAYAYCDTCGKTAILSGWAKNIPADVGLPMHQPITPAIETHLDACSCGGRFRAHASPRCPHCRYLLDAAGLTAEIEQNAPGTKGGWRWQQDWSGVYAIVIENRMTQDNWVADDAPNDV